ncbi:sigma-70 family RNA polymerase sigma factor [Amycolatopsis silviterrae]|uniref:Sigma-70 family RNA polymerase sigma factor n=1 Tax=Amycolatopsis silviterrae TaxID=1656914 RepID=A0ABW5HF03_9PSEU
MSVPTDHSDAELIAAVHGGMITAYSTLYERHCEAARNLARQLAKSAAEADDLVSEAFAKVFNALCAGQGPDCAFRPYLLTTLRRVAYDVTRQHRGIHLAEDLSEPIGKNTAALAVPFSDTVVAGLERTLVAKAFARLPERWQAVLWHTEIEEQRPAEVAPLLGLTPNGVSALAYRAREGLRQAYLQVHLSGDHAKGCRTTATRLGAWTRDGLSKRERAQVDNHLDGCESCRALASDLVDINGGLRVIIAPIVLGEAASDYLATVSEGKATAATSGAGAAAAAGKASVWPLVGVAVSGTIVFTAVANAASIMACTEASLSRPSVAYSQTSNASLYALFLSRLDDAINEPYVAPESKVKTY